VTTTALNTGPSSELVPSVPITSSGVSTVVYSLPISSLKADEVLRVTSNLEVTNTHSYDVTDSVRLALGSSPSDTDGETVTPWTSFQHTKDVLHWTFPLSGVYRASEDFGSTRYLNVIFKAASTSAQPNDTLKVQPNFGHLAATRYAPAVGPMAQPTHQLQALTTSLPEQVASLPVDGNWRRVLTRKVSDLSANDILDITGQLGIQNTSGATVQLESRITMSMQPSVGGDTASPIISSRMMSATSFDRVVHSNQFSVNDPAWRYMNLVVRAKPVSGTPQPLTVTAGQSALNVIRLKPSAGNPSAPLREGTLQQVGFDFDPNVTSIPFCPGGCEKRVVASAPLYEGLWKDEVIRARGLVTGDFNGGEVAQVLTQLAIADSPTETTGTVLAGLSGDKVPTAMQLHTSVKEATYIVPKAELATKYVNFVVYASRTPAYEGESMLVPAASLSFTRSKPTSALSADFEDGSLDRLFVFDNDGVASITSALAREGSKSLEINLDFSNNKGEDPQERRRVEVSPPDKRTSAGYYGEETWHGFSVYFPEDFKVPGIDNPELPDGTWNIFAQWHAEHDGDGLDCPLEGVGVPIGFGARYWKANGYTNPGASQTSTPVDGDYLEVSFTGGELNQDCTNTVKDSPQRFILGLLDRGRWYDFVLHTRWTTEEGGPGNSVAELWMNGKQVLGDQSTPVTFPVLLWHGTPAIHNNSAYLKFGLYRGPSEEEPKTRLYIDSFKRGNSYAEVAPGK
jgi:Polysaccharide lyase